MQYAYNMQGCSMGESLGGNVTEQIHVVARSTGLIDIGLRAAEHNRD